MGYNSTDSHNLDEARKLFGANFLASPSDDVKQYWCPIEQVSYPNADPVEVLADALQSSMRWDMGVHIWVEVKTPVIPKFVEEAMIRCAGFGLRAVITHGTRTSHAPGDDLDDPALIEALKRNSDRSSIWHPLAGEFVNAIAYQRNDDFVE